MRKYLKWFLAVVRPYKTNMIVMMLCHVMLTVCTIAFVYVSKVLIDMAVAIYSGPGWGGTPTQFPFTEPVSGNLMLWAALFLLIILARILLNSMRAWLQTKTEISLRNGLRKRLFDNLLHRTSIDGARNHSGDIVSRLQEDVRVVSSTFAGAVPGLVGAVLQFVAAFSFFLILEFRLAIVLVVVLPIGMFVGKIVMTKIRNLTAEIRKSDSKVHSYLQESIQHLSVLQSLEHSQTSLGQLEQLQKVVYGNELKRTKFSIVSRVMISMTFAAAQAIAFLWGVVGISCGTVTYGMMIAFLQLLSQLQRPLLEMSQQLPSIMHCTASIDRLVEIEFLQQEENEEPVIMQGVAGVRFTDVEFAYDGASANVFAHFSHDFKPGTSIAIVGRTGVGKTTMIKLMLAFLKPSSGSVEIYDNERVVPVSSATRCNLVFVPQGNSLFSGSIRENLLMGNPDASESQLQQALEMAAADFVFELPDGVDTQCFEAGAGLSEGQAQRIAIARALLRPGSVLLLDEFSSALDAETESLLMQRLTEGAKGKTMIFITHRDKILEYCDSVLSLDN